MNPLENIREPVSDAPWAYKDVANSVELCHNAGVARTVVRLRPIGVIEG